jgi:hypothetical protein
MTDEELVHAFESASLGEGEFNHRAHVRVAWWYLRHAPFAEARAQFVSALKRVAVHRGVPQLYHETITFASLVLIADRLARSQGLSWDAFAAAHPELLSRQPSILSRYYTEETLRSERARLEFVLPDRHPLPMSAALTRPCSSAPDATLASLSRDLAAPAARP